jgi:lipopolysaccharide biosynthesis regulator YciM
MTNPEMVDRNFEAARLEKRGLEEQARVLYELSVEQGTDAPQPYQRLRAIYTRRKQYGEALRVCEKYLALKTNDPRRNIEFMKHVEELKLKLPDKP